MKIFSKTLSVGCHKLKGTGLAPGALFSSAMAAVLAVAAPAIADLPAIPALPPVDTTASFTFAVLGDNRPDQETDALSVKFPQVIAEVLKAKPEFVVTTGDLIHGVNAVTPATLPDKLKLASKQYDDVLPVIKSLGVPIFFAAGNHEVKGGAPFQELYQKRVSEKLYYSFEHGSAHFVILDSDIVGQQGKITGEQFEWLKNDLTAADAKAQHTFLFMHQQPFPISLHIGSSLDNYPVERDKFVQLLLQHHVTALITGHEHLYDYHYWNAAGKIAPPGKDALLQIISGGAGASLYPSQYGGMFYHFLLIKVEGPRVTMSVVKDGNTYSADQVLALSPSAKLDKFYKPIP